NAVASVHNEGAAGPKRRECAPNEKNATRREHTHHLRARSGRIGEWPAKVKDGAKAEGAAQRRHCLQRGMIKRRKKEHEARFTQALRGAVWPQRNRHTT